VNCPESSFGGYYPSSAASPERIQPASAITVGRDGDRVLDRLTELADRRSTIAPAVTIPVQAAGHAGGLARHGERVDPVDQDCRRAVHSPAGGLVLITDYMPGDGDVAAVSEDLRQALL
jgi:hypothetical protein